jgi:hypothetical protein
MRRGKLLSASRIAPLSWSPPKPLRLPMALICAQ